MTICKILRESVYQDESMDPIRDAAERVKEIDTPKPVRVAFTGDSGTGKSSLINCLLDIDGIAPHVGLASRFINLAPRTHM